MRVHVSDDDGRKLYYEIRKNDDRKGWVTVGGDGFALRAYQHWHPIATIHTVSFNGREFWLTGKQLSIWTYVMGYYRRGKRCTLAAIAEYANCSRATVSRFLKRLDLWRVVDAISIRGRNGGMYLFTVPDRIGEADAHLAGARHTYASRRIARQRIAEAIRRLQLNRLKPLLLQYKLPPAPWSYNVNGWKGKQLELPALVVSTVATFKIDR